jgi:hypothetical protein
MPLDIAGRVADQSSAGRNCVPLLACELRLVNWKQVQVHTASPSALRLEAQTSHRPWEIHRTVTEVKLRTNITRPLPGFEPLLLILSSRRMKQKENNKNDEIPI